MLINSILKVHEFFLYIFDKCIDEYEYLYRIIIHIFNISFNLIYLIIYVTNISEKNVIDTVYWRYEKGFLLLNM